jgi:hypothetical protein
VAAAYNSLDITGSLGRYENARRYGHNACSIASDLYDFGLFRP